MASIIIEIKESGDVDIRSSNGGTLKEYQKNKSNKKGIKVEKGPASNIDMAAWYYGSPLCVWHGDILY